MNNYSILPNEILDKIYLYAHPKLDLKLQEQIKNFKFMKIEIYAYNYNILRIMDGLNGTRFSN